MRTHAARNNLIEFPQAAILAILRAAHPYRIAIGDLAGRCMKVRDPDAQPTDTLWPRMPIILIRDARRPSGYLAQNIMFSFLHFLFF